MVSPGEPQVRNGCSDAEVVRREVERLRDELEERAMDSYARRAGCAEYIPSGLHWKLLHEYRDGVEEALDALVALAAGKPWPPESEKP